MFRAAAWDTQPANQITAAASGSSARLRDWRPVPGLVPGIVRGLCLLLLSTSMARSGQRKVTSMSRSSLKQIEIAGTIGSELWVRRETNPPQFNNSWYFVPRETEMQDTWVARGGWATSEKEVEPRVIYPTVPFVLGVIPISRASKFPNDAR